MMKRDNDETMLQILDDTETEIDGIKKFGQENKGLVEEMGRRSKADLQSYKGNVQDIGGEIERLNRQIQEKKAVHEKKLI